MKSEYAAAGVDPAKISPFKRAMIEVGQKTLTFPNRRGVFINQKLMHAHGAVYEYCGTQRHIWCKTQEGLGNKNWIAEWMYMYDDDGTGRTYYDQIAICTALMAVNDNIAQGAMPVVFTDEVAPGDSDWFADEKRARDLARGFYDVCRVVGMALPAGESPAYRYLVKSEPPVKSAPVLSGSVTGIVAPASRLITGEKLTAGDRIIGVTSSGLHANGISLVIKRAMGLPDQFLTKILPGRILGKEALVPTRSYVGLMEALLEAEVDIHAIVPGTGDGVAKVAFDDRPFTYRIGEWVKEIPPIFQFMQQLGVSYHDCLTTFNWGIGYYIFVPAREVDRVVAIGCKAGYELFEIGRVEEGERQTIFEPKGHERIILPPPPGQ